MRFWVYFFAFLFVVTLLGGFIFDRMITAGLVAVTCSTVLLVAIFAYFRK